MKAAKKSLWQVNYDSAMKMAKDGKGDIYDRVVLLTEVYEDDEFTKEMARRGTSPGVFLNSAVDETFATFSELYAMLKTFPNRKQWIGGDLRSMRAALVENLDKKRKDKEDKRRKDQEKDPDHGTSNPVNRLSWKEKYLDMHRKYETLLARYRQLEKNYEALNRQIGSSRSA